ncbi:MAG: STAS domain-containing protein, partial [Acidimicrobiales bacterium]
RVRLQREVRAAEDARNRFLNSNLRLVVAHARKFRGAEGIDFIDTQGSSTLAEIHQLATAYGAQLRLARVKPEVRDLLERDGVIDELGEDQIFGNVYEAASDRIVEPPGT